MADTQVKLVGGTASVTIEYADEKVNIGQGKKKKEVTKRVTKLSIKLPNGKTLISQVASDSRDKFNKGYGRKAAILKLFKGDTDTAQTTVERMAVGGKLGSKVEAGSLSETAKKFYNISRPDRETLFKVICPQFFRNDPDRVKQREKALYERLAAKYGTGTTKKTTTIKQKFGDVKAGATVVGVSIGKLG